MSKSVVEFIATDSFYETQRTYERALDLFETKMGSVLREKRRPLHIKMYIEVSDAE